MGNLLASALPGYPAITLGTMGIAEEDEGRSRFGLDPRTFETMPRIAGPVPGTAMRLHRGGTE